MENVVSVAFAVESEAYQAMSILKRNAVSDLYVISQAALIKKVDGRMVTEDAFDTGATTADDTHLGGLVGGLLGIVGGPVGMLLSGSLGALTGSVIDSVEAGQGASLLEKVSEQFVDGETGILLLAQEENTAALDMVLSKFKTTIVREDAAEVAEEVRHAEEMEREMEREARKKLREEKKEEHKQAVEERRAKMKSDFDALKKKFSTE